MVDQVRGAIQSVSQSWNGIFVVIMVWVPHLQNDLLHNMHNINLNSLLVTTRDGLRPPGS